MILPMLRVFLGVCYAVFHSDHPSVNQSLFLVSGYLGLRAGPCTGTPWGGVTCGEGSSSRGLGLLPVRGHPDLSPLPQVQGCASLRGKVCLWSVVTLRAKPCKGLTWSEAESIYSGFPPRAGGAAKNAARLWHSYCWTSRSFQSRGAVECFPVRALPSSSNTAHEPSLPCYLFDEPEKMLAVCPSAACLSPRGCRSTHLAFCYLERTRLPPRSLTVGR